MTVGNALNINESGLQSFDGVSVFRGRTLTAGTGISISNGNGIAGNPIISSTSTPTPSPNKLINFVDDFISSGTSSGQLFWTTTGNMQIKEGTSAHPGIIRNESINLSTIAGLMLNNSSVNSFVVGGGELKVNNVFELVTLSNNPDRYIFNVGLTENTSLSALTNGIYFSYSDNVNSGNWQAICESAAVPTTINTSIPAVTGYVNLGFVVNSSGTSVEFFINQVSVGSIATNIPTTALSPFIMWTLDVGYVAANHPAANFDLFYLSNLLTTAR